MITFRTSRWISVSRGVDENDDPSDGGAGLGGGSGAGGVDEDKDGPV